LYVYFCIVRKDNANFSQLRHFLAPSSLSDESVQLLTNRCEHLQVLKLSECQQLTDMSLTMLSKCVSLIQLSLPRLASEGSIVPISVSCTNLEHFDISENSVVTSIAVRNLLRNCRTLKTLAIAGDRAVNSAAFDVLADPITYPSGVQLETLNALMLPITDDALHSISKRCVNLRVLDLERNLAMTDVGLAAVAQCSRLQRLSIEYCPMVSNEGVSKLARCTSLQYLNIYGCEAVTVEGLIPLIQHCKALKELNISVRLIKPLRSQLTALSELKVTCSRNAAE